MKQQKFLDYDIEELYYQLKCILDELMHTNKEQVIFTIVKFMSKKTCDQFPNQKQQMIPQLIIQFRRVTYITLNIVIKLSY